MDSDLKALIALMAILLVVIFGGAFALAWLDAGWKQEALERQGVKMSKWDVMVLDPKVRIVNGQVQVAADTDDS